jgi:hypothetical protein
VEAIAAVHGMSRPSAEALKEYLEDAANERSL